MEIGGLGPGEYRVSCLNQDPLTNTNNVISLLKCKIKPEKSTNFNAHVLYDHTHKLYLTNIGLTLLMYRHAFCMYFQEGEFPQGGRLKENRFHSILQTENSNYSE